MKKKIYICQVIYFSSLFYSLKKGYQQICVRPYIKHVFIYFLLIVIYIYSVHYFVLINIKMNINKNVF